MNYAYEDYDYFVGHCGVCGEGDGDKPVAPEETEEDKEEDKEEDTEGGEGTEEQAQ